MSQLWSPPAGAQVDPNAAYAALCGELGLARGEIVQLRQIIDGLAERVAYLQSLTEPKE